MPYDDPTPLGRIMDERVPEGLGGRWYGAHPALVEDVKDPEGQGRVLVTLPWMPDTGSARYAAWARLATLMGGDNRGSWFIPDPGDEVLVLFEGGDLRRPYVIGGLWNGRDRPPAGMDGAGRNTTKRLRSRNGVVVTLEDQDGQESLVCETPGGQRLTLKDGPGMVEILDSNGNSLRLETSGITVNAALKVTVSATLLEVSAAQVTVNAGLSRFSGVVQADTVISNSVISASYTPGAGNIW